MLYDFLHAHWLLISEFLILLLVLLALVTVSGMAMARFDGLSAEDGIYFAFITALTIGFGDFVPKSRASRVIAILLALLGLVIVGILVAVAVHAVDYALEQSTGTTRLR